MFTIYDTENDRFNIVQEPDPAASYTFADFLQWKFEDRLELIYGRIYKLGAHNTRHEDIAKNLLHSLSLFLKNKECQVYGTSFQVRLPLDNRKKDDEITTVVQPDVCICNNNIIDEKGCCGPPELVIEILSPGNTHKEIKLKYALYQEAGVKEYWIIYPVEESVAAFVLNEDGKYNGATLYAGRDGIQSTAIPGMLINTKDIFIKHSL